MSYRYTWENQNSAALISQNFYSYKKDEREKSGYFLTQWWSDYQPKYSVSLFLREFTFRPLFCYFLHLFASV
jgi:hypothetical protein